MITYRSVTVSHFLEIHLELTLMVMRLHHLLIFQECAFLMNNLCFTVKLEMLLAVRNGNVTLHCLSPYDIECLLANIATLYLLQFDYYHNYCISHVYLHHYCV